MSKISLKQLEAFTQISKEGSFRAAAISLNTTQPNISSRIAKLEAQLGQTLMHRDAGSIRLTALGEQLLPKAQDILSKLDHFLVAANNTELFEGGLRLGVTETIAHSWLGDFLSAFAEAFPNIRIELTVDLSVNLTEGLKNGSIDLALQSGPFKSELSNSVNLSSVPLIWVASPILTMPDMRLVPEDMCRYAILTHAKNTAPYQQLAKHFADIGQKARLVSSTNLGACLQMTVQGIGIACLPEAIVRAAIEEGTLVQLDYSWVPDTLDFEARYNESFAVPHYIKQAGMIAAKAAQSNAQKK